MNLNQRGRLPKHKRSMSSKEKSDSDSTREMVVISKESLLEMEEKLQILSESKLICNRKSKNIITYGKLEEVGSCLTPANILLTKGKDL